MSILQSHILKHAICSGAVQVIVVMMMMMMMMMIMKMMMMMIIMMTMMVTMMMVTVMSTFTFLRLLQGQVSVTSVGGRQVEI